MAEQKTRVYKHEVMVTQVDGCMKHLWCWTCDRTFQECDPMAGVVLEELRSLKCQHIKPGVRMVLDSLQPTRRVKL